MGHFKHPLWCLGDENSKKWGSITFVGTILGVSSVFENLLKTYKKLILNMTEYDYELIFLCENGPMFHKC